MKGSRRLGDLYRSIRKPTAPPTRREKDRREEARRRDARREMDEQLERGKRGGAGEDDT